MRDTHPRESEQKGNSQQTVIVLEDGPVAGHPIPVQKIPPAYVHTHSLQRYKDICKGLKKPGQARRVDGVHPTGVRNALKRLASLGELDKDRYIVRIRERGDPSVNSGRGVAYVIYLPDNPDQRKKMIESIDSPGRERPDAGED